MAILPMRRNRAMVTQKVAAGPLHKAHLAAQLLSAILTLLRLQVTPQKAAAAGMMTGAETMGAATAATLIVIAFSLQALPRLKIYWPIKPPLR